MDLVTGYNLVRAGGLLDFQQSFHSRFPDEIQPERLSIVGFLRHVYLKEPLPHKCCEIIGLERLLAGAEDDARMPEYIHDLLVRAANFLYNKGYFLYFSLESSTTFMPGPTLQLRTSDGKYIAIAPIFGRMQLVGQEHYQSGFNISS